MWRRLDTPVVTGGVNVDLDGAAVVDTTDNAVVVDAGLGQGAGAAATVEVGNGAATVDLGATRMATRRRRRRGWRAILVSGPTVDLGLDEGEKDNSGPGNNSGNGNSGNGNEQQWVPGNVAMTSGPTWTSDSTKTRRTIGHGPGKANGTATATAVDVGNGPRRDRGSTDLAVDVATGSPPAAIDVSVGLGNAQVDLGVDLGAVTDIDLGLDEEENDNSGPGNDNSNSGSGNSGSGSGNSGSGNDNSGPGNVVDDVLDSLTRRSGRK